VRSLHFGTLNARVCVCVWMYLCRKYKLLKLTVSQSFCAKRTVKTGMTSQSAEHNSECQLHLNATISPARFLLQCNVAHELVQ
jgi:hypothetical protein